MKNTRRENGPSAQATPRPRAGAPSSSSEARSATASVRRIGRYLLCDAIASGGMATVHLGRFVGPQGFSRTVAIKQLHQHFARSSEFVAMFLDEARILSRIRHPHVVAPLDVLVLDGELFIVMEYVHGASFSELLDACRGPVPSRIASAIVIQMLLGLHAAHEATSERGEPLSIVHRDISPHNVLVGSDGIARVADFGIAKAESRARTTGDGTLKGKLGYMAPEQLRSAPVDRKTDLFACGIVLWEALTGERLYAADNIVALFDKVENKTISPPSELVPVLPRAVDDLVRRALTLDPPQRFSTAREMALELERALPPASTLEVSEWVNGLVGPHLRVRAERISELESVDAGELPLNASGSNPAADVHATTLPVSVTTDDTLAAGVPETLAAIGVNRTAAIPLRAASPVAATTTFQAVTAAPTGAEADGVRNLISETSRSAANRRLARVLWLAAPLALCAAAFGAYWQRATPHAVNGNSGGFAASSARLSGTGDSGSAGVASSLPPRLEPPRPLSTAWPTASTSVGTPRLSATQAPKPGVVARTPVPRAASSSPTSPASPALPAATSSAAQSTAGRSSGSQRKCAVPYFVDDQGVKRFKPECF